MVFVVIAGFAGKANLMETFWSAVGIEPLTAETAGMTARLVVAALLGAVVGWERESRGRAAGLRTHMLVAVGSALFTLIVVRGGGGTPQVAEVVKGIAAGIGFLGAGAILKNANDTQIVGLTTAAGIWLTSAMGVAAGAGWVVMATITTLLGWMILFALGRLEHWIERQRQ
jgi:putative Mg2+ transporter-C (MgtC) family protein